MKTFYFITGILLQLAGLFIGFVFQTALVGIILYFSGMIIFILSSILRNQEVIKNNQYLILEKLNEPKEK